MLLSPVPYLHRLWSENEHVMQVKVQAEEGNKLIFIFTIIYCSKIIKMIQGIFKRKLKFLPFPINIEKTIIWTARRFISAFKPSAKLMTTVRGID